jgi:hypothetical protein
VRAVARLDDCCPFAARLLNPVQTFVMRFKIRTDRGRFGREPGPAGRDCHGLHGL